ncbi:MAG: hypothetical protein JW910_17575 [Anaerolineae bacterium]|nr:hypothetical protein [Anaerolineae bacterium]
MSQRAIGGGQISPQLQRALGAGEDVIFFQRTMDSLFGFPLRRVGCAIGLVLLQASCGLIFGSGISQGVSESTSGVRENTPEWMTGAVTVLWVAAFLVVVTTYSMAVHEYAVTSTRLLIGKHSWKRFSYDVVAIDMITAVRVASSFRLGSFLSWSAVQVQYGGGKIDLPVLGGQGGQDLMAVLTRLMEERRTHSSVHQTAAAPPPAYAAPPPASPAPAFDKQAELNLLRQRLLEGQISEETYNRLRKEIEES